MANDTRPGNSVGSHSWPHFSHPQALLDVVPDIIAIVDVNKVYVWANLAAYAFFGDDMIGRTASDYFEGPQDTYEVVRPLFDGAESMVYVESWQRRRDGEKRLLAWWCRRFVDASGKPMGALSSARDITDSKMAEKALQRSKEKLDLAQAVSQTGSWHLDIPTGTLEWSDETFRIFDVEPRKKIDLQFFIGCVYPKDRSKLLSAWNAALHGEPYDIEHRILVEGKIRWVRERAEVHFSPDGIPLFGIGTVQDITERKRAEEKLSQAATVFTSLREGVTITDREGNVIAVNPAFTAITGYSESEVLGQNMRIMHSHHQGPAFYHAMWASLLAHGHWQGEIWNRRKGGETYSQWLTISAVRDAHGAVVNYVGVFTDISPIKQTEARLEYLAQHDALTDLPNRRMLFSHLERALERVRRKGGCGAVLFLDLDRFKAVNDTLGHPAGDQLLQLVALRLRERVRDTDIVARLGGDEFVVLIEDLGNPGDAATVAGNIIQRLAAPFHLAGGHEVHIGVSIGISLFPGDGDCAEGLIQHADAALYQAKEDGRNIYRFYAASQTVEITQRLNQASLLRQAIGRDEFVLHYQPIVGLDDGHLTGVEALLRWRSPTAGLALPERFLPLAEETGLIEPLGEWALREACTQMKAWQDAGLALDTLTVNLSPRQCRQINLPQRLGAILAETGLPAHFLQLDITEDGIMALGPRAEDQLKALKKLGVRLAIDDFGTGYSSLVHLKRYPVDTLKIGINLVLAIPQDPEAMEIAATIAAMARSLKLGVQAEGVETEAQQRFLTSQGCTYGQGYLFAAPMPAPELSRKWHPTPSSAGYQGSQNA